MIGHFPEPYPDELLYSVIARCRTRLNEKRSGGFIFRLFEDEHARAKIDLPDRLIFLSRNVPGTFYLAPEAMAYRLTLLPYYEPFLREQLGKQLHSAMLHGTSDHRTIPSLSPLKIAQPTHLRYCPQCTREDFASVGELYWRRTHQVPGIRLCSLHGSALLSSVVSWSFRSSWQKYVEASALNQRGRAKYLVIPGKQEVHHSLARDANWLLNSRPGVSAEVLGSVYRELLKKRGLTFKRNIRLSLVRSLVIDKIGHTTLRSLRSPLRDESDFDWLSQLLRPSRFRRVGQAPLRHLLLIHCLGFTAESFFAEVEKYSMRAVERPEATAEEDKRNLKRWWFDRSISVNAMGRQLKMRPDEVSMMAARQGLPFPRAGNRGSRTKFSEVSRSATELREERRSSFRQLKQIYAGGGMAALVLVNPSLIRWLRRHDWAWLQQNRPKGIRAGGTRGINWNARDTRCEERLHKILQVLRVSGEVPSISAIERKLRIRLSSSLQKMPKTHRRVTVFLTERNGIISSTGEGKTQK